jgi:glycosyltransferase involved in cell wall biosynthesis
MNILMVTSLPLPPKEGVGNHIYNLGRTLQSMGHRVTVVTRDGLGWRNENIGGLEVLAAPFLPLYPFHVPFHGIFLNRLVDGLNRDFDVIHYHSPLVPVLRCPTPSVVTIHTLMKVAASHTEMVSPLSLAIKLQAPFSTMYEKALVERSRLCMTVSSSVAEEMALLGVPESEVLVTRNGVDIEMFHPAVAIRGTSGKPVVVYAGRLAPQKGLMELVEAAAAVRARMPGVKFLLAGDGPLGPAIRRKVEALGLADCFEFIGHIQQPQLPAVYAQATVYVQPSRYEGLPGTLLEAMASGCAIVATAVSGHREALSDGDNGLLVPPRDPTSLAEGILRLLEDAPFRSTLGAAARATVESNFTWRTVAERALAGYYQAIRPKD